MAIGRTTLTSGLAAIGFSSAVATGLASAQPDLSPLVNTTCTYQQVMAALGGAQAPDLAAELSKYPPAQAKLQKKFLAAPIDTRQKLIQQAWRAIHNGRRRSTRRPAHLKGSKHNRCCSRWPAPVTTTEAEERRPRQSVRREDPVSRQHVHRVRGPPPARSTTRGLPPR